VNRWLGLAALVALAAVGIYVAFRQTAPPDVFPGAVDRSSVTRLSPVADAGSLDNLLDATQIEHAIGGR
jgi:hypothetical protein